MSWRSTQFLAEVSLLLNEISRGTIETLCRTNKLVREMRRDAGQRLLFPSSWKIKRVQDLAVATWADASQHNRPDRSSTLGILTGVAPREILQGIETQVARFSGKVERLHLSVWGQMVLAEIGGVDLCQGDLHLAVQEISGALVMDSLFTVYVIAGQDMS